MKYSIENYKVLGERFSSQSFLGKLVLAKQNAELFSIETDGVNLRLRINDEDAMKAGIDSYFSFPEFVDFEVMRDICKLADLNIKELK